MSSAPAPGGSADLPRGPHLAQFYEDDSHLLDVVVRYTRGALLGGHAVVWIVTEAHRMELLDRLRALCGDGVREAQRGQRFVILEAEATLERFLTETGPSRERFRAIVSRVLDSLPAGAQVFAFGEMVNVLALGGRRTEALQLEALWNELGAERNFSLLCGYAMDAFPDGASSAAFTGACAAHSEVFPAESYSALESEEARRRRVAELAQYARSLEADVRDARRVARQYEAALRLRDEFVARVGEAMRRPIRALEDALAELASYAAMIKESAVASMARTLQEHSSGLATATERLVDVSQLASGTLTLRLEPFELGELVEEVVRQKGAASPHLEVSAEGAVLGQWDRSRIRQVVAHLVDNAIKFGLDAPVSVSVSQTRDRARVIVRDRGIGIALPDQARVFRRFERAAGSSYPGVGLGLWICRRLVEAHGGVLSVESELGRGATFTVELPLRASVR